MSFSWLPGVLEQIAKEAGIDAAMKLARLWGGRMVYIPAHPLQGHWLTDAVGMDAAEKICAIFRTNESGARVLIPMANAAVTRRTLANAIAQNLSARECAGLANCHERTVFRHRATHRRHEIRNKDQLKLF